MKELDIAGKTVYVAPKRALEEVSFTLAFEPDEWQRLRGQWEARTFMRFVLTDLEMMPRHNDKPEVRIKLMRVAD